MSTQTAIRISGLNNKITAPILESNFSMVGPVLKVELYDDLQSNKCAQVMFENEELAMKAVEQYNGKQLLKDKILVELIKIDLDKEQIGEVVYPVAKNLFPNQAPKITGMICESILSLSGSRTRSQFQEVLSSESYVTELVKAANTKLTSI